MKNIPYSRHQIRQADINAVRGVLKTDWITQGPVIREFEEALCAYTGAKYAVAVSSGTAALHCAVEGLGIGTGDSIITSPVTFSASANCAIYAGATPMFCDINGKTWHMDLDGLERMLSRPAERKRCKAVIPVHFMGTVMDIGRLQRICSRYGIRIIEDAAHALGARYLARQGGRVGCCRDSDAAILSFHPIKHITTGEGGALLTNDKSVYERAVRMRHHGIVKNPATTTERRLKPYLSEPWFYDIPEVGYNYRITDFQCALGTSQLKRLDRAIAERRRLVQRYRESFSGLAQVTLPFEQKGTFASYHLFVIRVPAWKRNGLYQFLKANGVLAQVNYIPVHLLSSYRRRFGYRWGDFPESERYFQECLSLPLYPGLSMTQQERVIALIRRFFHER